MWLLAVFLPGSRLCLYFRTTGPSSLPGSDLLASFSCSVIKVSKSPRDIVLNTLEGREEEVIAVTAPPRWNISSGLLTVLVWSQLNKTDGLMSEPFMKGMFLVENFRRDLGNKSPSLVISVQQCRTSKHLRAPHSNPRHERPDPPQASHPQMQPAALKPTLRFILTKKICSYK